ncbi:Mandelate racemase/muconate lactonizing protein [Beutenbergia cavernae DSM 12333]|uniref:L-fuconate dehydratase n=1 Tax=Beutenbergia cavernae (strain ATCC BAA-8 / DSM 12333 / CCUG 43141 / JCM 11478 / NBRC 16432 / NCIMB 13614 / HKI 0122) TaxID=471853 RepID=C5C5V3_BEUC1|nr:enolase C-terminal domain-like protein [Beutenbergia cavernae]ACQ82311.1 Mandelate racemase/muconate lactonizing protein [Beutenbergia cavernae DSM 12333]
MPTITGVTVTDVRFPTSLELDGSDAMNPDCDYSAAYVVLETDGTAGDGAPLAGYGLTFTIGRGTDIVVEAATQQAALLVGRDTDAIARDMGGLYRDLTADSQLRWLGPEKGVVHLSLAAVMNAAWDLVARQAGKPLWRLLADLTPEQLVDVADLRYLSDVLTREDAVALLREREGGKAERLAELERRGYPVYTTSAGWLGYDDAKLRRLCQEAVDEGYSHVKLKVGANVDDDRRRLAIAREVIGPDRKLMIDANQVWDVPQAIEWVRALSDFDLHWIEEPTSPDDILGHAAIREALAPIGVATGEHCHNRVMFKQLIQAGSLDFLQLDTGRLASINEIVAVLLLAAHTGVKVCPHAGGVGLCEMVQHVSVLDYVAIGADLDGRVTEYVEHLHEHFTDPVEVRDDGEGPGYVVPSRPGYSTEMFPESVATYTFRDGAYWAGARAAAEDVAGAAS